MMAGVSLYDYQLEAVKELQTGSILCGDVGSGKSRTALAYYYLKNGGELNTENYVPMDGINIQDLYIITTARKRDTLEWEEELGPFLLNTDDKLNLYSNHVYIDSWNNMHKYENAENAFFIFDEQRVVGSGAWVKSFLRITKKNDWILLSATPGDTWTDYIPVFVANGFFKNRSEFLREHVIYSRFSKFPKIDRYLNTGRLVRLRNRILVNMDFKRSTNSHHEDVYVDYDIFAYKEASRTRWNPYLQRPMENAGELCQVWRRIINSDQSRQTALLMLFEDHPRMIVFYNYDYELDILKTLFSQFSHVEVAEWNGHKHQPIPESDIWVYLVQYNAGAEGWNCIKTDTIVFYSANYSYRIMTQAAGRINRLNTPFRDLYYYHLKSHAGIDLAIDRALKRKKTFNESSFVRWK